MAMVAIMEVDKVADKVANIKKIDININMKIQFSEKVGLVNWAQTSSTRSLLGFCIFSALRVYFSF